VSIQSNLAESRAPYWKVPIARAIPALLVAVIVTFTSNHSSQVGLTVFGAYASFSGLIIAALSILLLADKPAQRLFVAQGAIGLIVGVGALIFADGGIAFLLYLMTIYAAITGFLELYSGLRARGSMLAKDWIAVGGFTALLAIVFLIIPPDLVLAIGLFGVYAVIVGVYLVIAGFSLKWSPQPSFSAPSTRETMS